MAELMSLRIPMGWAVSDNKFYDAEPVAEESGWINNWNEGFTTDIPWIQECRFDGEKYSVPNIHSFHITIDWNPANYLSGEYLASLKWCTTDELIEIDSIASRNRYEIRDKLDYWMNDISENYEVWRSKTPDLEAS